VAEATTQEASPPNWRSAGSIAMAVGFAAMGGPTLMALGEQSWSKEFGAYGPIVLVTGLWLLARQLPALRRDGRPGALPLTILLLALALVSYTLGQAFGFVTLETAGVFGLLLAALQAHFGTRALARHWFPIVYLAFVIPPPSSILADVTAPLKQFVSMASTDTLAALGFPVSREGVTIFIAQYQLLVEDACSGMNSIVGLIAVGLLYIYLVRGASWRYSLALLTCIVPVAIFANIVRIMILILLTYFAGNDVAQGYLHFTAGIILFATALACVFGLDRFMAYLVSRFRSAP
jgi:exosortase